MNDDSTNQIVRAINAARRDNWIIISLLLIFLVGSIIYAHWSTNKYIHPNPKTYVYTWKDVRSAEDQLDYYNAIAIIESVIIKKYPNDSYAYSYSGDLYRRMGEFKEAEKAYEKAYIIFPSEDNQKLLETIRAKNQNKP